MKDPTKPEIVFFGLIFVSFGPLNIFPNKYPPISEAIHPNNKASSNYLKLILVLDRYFQ